MEDGGGGGGGMKLGLKQRIKIVFRESVFAIDRPGRLL